MESLTLVHRDRLIATTAPIVADKAALAAEVRKTLDGQTAYSRTAAVAAIYGPVYRLDEVRERIRKTLPFRPFRERRMTLEVIERYTKFIPDEALLKYAEAKALRHADGSPYFDVFAVAEPIYWEEEAINDPWLLGFWRPESSPRETWNWRRVDSDVVVIAYWK